MSERMTMRYDLSDSSEEQVHQLLNNRLYPLRKEIRTLISDSVLTFINEPAMIEKLTEMSKSLDSLIEDVQDRELQEEPALR